MCAGIVGHVIWVIIWDGFNHTAGNYVGFYRPMSVFTQLYDISGMIILSEVLL